MRDQDHLAEEFYYVETNDYSRHNMKGAGEPRKFWVEVKRRPLLRIGIPAAVLLLVVVISTAAVLATKNHNQGAATSTPSTGVISLNDTDAAAVNNGPVFIVGAPAAEPSYGEGPAFIAPSDPGAVFAQTTEATPTFLSPEEEPGWTQPRPGYTPPESSTDIEASVNSTSTPDIVVTSSFSSDSFVPTSTATPTPTGPPPPPQPKTTENLSSFAGGNSWFIHAQNEDVRHKIYKNYQDAGLKTMRIFLREFTGKLWGDSGVDYVYIKGVNHVNDVENKDGYFDDSQLDLINQIMTEVIPYGIKLIISLHDNWYMGLWEGCDAYCQRHVAKGDNWAFRKFYENKIEGAWDQIDARIAHIMSYPNPYFQGRTWGNIPEAVFMIEHGNEDMGHSDGDTQYALSNEKTYTDWHCGRARVVKSFVQPGSQVLVGQGGGRGVAQSKFEGLFKCDALDVITVHDYGGSSCDDSGIKDVVKLAQKYSKRTFVEEFGVDGDNWTKASGNDGRINEYIKCGVPWMVWSIVGVSDSAKEVWPDQPDAWKTIVKRSQAQGSQWSPFTWPELASTY
ncbi:hypothetical protein HK101_005378 [Irineochytrium annulatum]|nr:hypothetical protein HK101_005378 [Irineochytrium annulatum]